MLGGILEFNAMYFGFQMLYLLALELYAAALLNLLLFREQNAPAASMLPALVSRRIEG